MRSVMTHQFSQVPRAEIPRSTFDRSHGHKTTFDAGYLIPIFLDEALPGDTFSLRATMFARTATPIFPIMDNMFMDTQYFAVPVRLLWDNWRKMMGEQDNPGDSTDFTVPQMTAPAGGYGEQSLEDYMGLPTKVVITHSALFHRAIQLTFNEWYRDQNLQNSRVVNRGDGPDDPADYKLERRGKRHDYFTSCLPWPQKGESVSIPLGTQATVTHDAADGGTLGAYSTVNSEARNLVSSTSNLTAGTLTQNTGVLYADLTTATATTINQLRQAFQIQKMLERDARGGTRLVEVIRAHFGVISPDYRMQRPEFLGGGSIAVNITPVPQTNSTDATSPQGNLAAYGTATGQNGFTKSFTEHCIIVGFVSIRADLNYQQGLDRMFSRQTRYDFYWPALSHIGEQAVLNKEIYAQGDANDDLVFGYQERHAEYRYKPSRITGRFRSTAAQPLDSWHLAQHYTGLPVLGEMFIQENPPVDRVIAVQDEPQFIFDSYFQMHCARPMPVYGVPGLIDHFSGAPSSVHY